MRQRVLLATFSIRPHHATEALSPPFPHFDPFGTEFREPGRISHPTSHIADFQFQLKRNSHALQNWQSETDNWQLQRSFQLAPEFLASSRQSRFHRSYTYIERRRDLFVSKTFDVSQDHCFSINTS